MVHLIANYIIVVSYSKYNAVVYTLRRSHARLLLLFLRNRLLRTCAINTKNIIRTRLLYYTFLVSRASTNNIIEFSCRVIHYVNFIFVLYCIAYIYFVSCSILVLYLTYRVSRIIFFFIQQ